MDLQKHLGARIRRARRAANLTQEQLAERLDKSVRTISNIESGNVLVGLDTLSEIGVLFNLPLVYFLEDYEQKSGHNASRRELWEHLILLLQSATDRELSIISTLVIALTDHREDEAARSDADQSKATEN